MSKDNRQKQYFLKATLLFVSILTVMSAATIAPSLPLIAKVFQDTPNAALLSKLLLSIPALFIAISAPIAGKFIDRYGRIKLLYVGLILYILSGTSGYFLNNLYHILIGRVLLGISIGITMTIAITLIGDYFEGEERSRFVGLQGAFIALGGVVFITFGGFLADIDWRTPFLIYGLAIFLIPLIIFYLPEPERSEARIELKREKPSRMLRALFFTTLLFMILFYIIPTQLPFYLKEIGVNKQSFVGLALGINALGGVIGSLIFSKLKQRMSFTAILSVGFAIMSMGYFGTGLSLSYIFVTAFLFIAGLGFGLILPNINLWVIQLTKAEIRGKNMGILTTFMFFGQFLSPIVVHPLVASINLSGVILIAAGCLLSISLLFLLLKSFTK